MAYGHIGIANKAKRIDYCIILWVEIFKFTTQCSKQLVVGKIGHK